MSALYLTRLQKLKTPASYPFLTQIQRGIEKEGLRITPQATTAQTVHPQTLGSALTHSSITTDYSEALLEFITPVFRQIDDSINYLSDLHNFTQRNLKDEYIWPASMPCRLAGEDSIPIAQYGTSNIGQMKYIYRQGLAHRYGRIMQSIAGIHYNFSMPEEFWPYCQQLWGSKGDLQAFKSERYFGLIRNVNRHSWLLSYLFGASPVLDSSFMDNKDHQLDTLSENTLGLPFATSLRMSDLGYQSKAQASLKLSHNNLDSYIQGMTQAIQQPYSDYENLGIKVNGQYRQLNSNILQLENEYYSEVRPKRVAHAGEKPLAALKDRGVEYVEMRLLDTNPFLPVGIDAQQIRFLDTFLLYCLLSDSPDITAEELKEIKYNQQQVILEGRKPSLQLQQAGKEVAFEQMAKQLLTEITPIAALLDQAHQNQANQYLENGIPSANYEHAIQEQMDKVADSELTPSGKVMRAIANGDSFAAIMLEQAKKHQMELLERGLSDTTHAELMRFTEESLQQQRQLEENEVHSFDEFLSQYHAV